MSARTVKVHFLSGYVNAAGAHRTICGRFGWDDHGAEVVRQVDEFTDAYNNLFEATAKHEKVTCGLCLRAMAR